MHGIGTAPDQLGRLPRLAYLSLVLLLGSGGVAACGADEARDAVIRELALGAWDCAPDAEGSGEQPFTVRIDREGTFDVTFERPAEDVVLPDGEISGTWAIDDGDLEWALVEPRGLPPFTVPGFDALNLESTRFTLQNAGLFEVNDGLPEEQHFDVDAAGKDSVTFSAPDGDPWTCDRQGG